MQGDPHGVTRAAARSASQASSTAAVSHGWRFSTTGSALASSSIWGAVASDGAHGLLLRAADSDAPETLRDLLQPLGPLAAFYYRRLVIEELVSAPAGPAR